MAASTLPTSAEIIHHIPLRPPVSENGENVSLNGAIVSPMNLLSIALHNNAAIDVIERLAALQEKIMLRDAEIRFNDALSRVQAEIKRVAPDLQNPQTSSRYASYAAIDRVIRPIYTREGMSLSFSHADCPKADHVRVICFVSLGAYTRNYQMDMPVDTKGPQGKDVMTKTHGTATADSYAKRYLIKDVFNIAIGEADSDGNSSHASGLDDERTNQLGTAIANARTVDELRTVYFAAYREAENAKDRTAMQLFITTAKARKREIQ